MGSGSCTPAATDTNGRNTGQTQTVTLNTIGGGYQSTAVGRWVIKTMEQVLNRDFEGSGVEANAVNEATLTGPSTACNVKVEVMTWLTLSATVTEYVTPDNYDNLIGEINKHSDYTKVQAVSNDNGIKFISSGDWADWHDFYVLGDTAVSVLTRKHSGMNGGRYFVKQFSFAPYLRKYRNG